MPIKRKEQTLILHPQRKEIYKILCETPGLYFFELSNILSLPQGTIDWHLRQLEKANLIKSIKFGGKRVYYPRNLRTEEVEMAFTAIKHPTAKKIFSCIANNEGTYQSDIARELNLHHDTVRHHVERMIEAGLISKYKEGRKTCYKLGPLGNKIQEESISSISDTYVSALIDILEDNCLVPTIIEKTKKSLTIRIECPGHQDTTFSISLGDWVLGEVEEKEILTEKKEQVDSLA